MIFEMTACGRFRNFEEKGCLKLPAAGGTAFILNPFITDNRNISMVINTHTLIDQELCGTPLHVDSGRSRVELRTTRKMIVDQTGLVHGGFIFGLADYAAMIAVNHPNVVLGASDVKFIKPVKVDETVTAEATVENSEGKKQVVAVTVSNGGETVFAGTFTCFVLEKHVLK